MISIGTPQPLTYSTYKIDGHSAAEVKVSTEGGEVGEDQRKRKWRGEEQSRTIIPS